MKYVIWGAGEKGKRLLYHLNAQAIEAFIDSDQNKVGKLFYGKKIIDFDEYKENYIDCYIIISFSHEDEIVTLLNENGIYHYFLLTECPGEFQESYSRNILKNYILTYLKKDKTYVIYGCTLYSLILCDWIKQKLGIQMTVVPHMKMGSELLKKLKQDILKNYLWSIEDLQKQKVDEILLTVEQDLDVVQNYVKNRVKVTNVYDCTDRIEEYYNPEIEKFKNIHKGKRCFIVATGPSLKISDLDILEENHEICISFNSIWKAFNDTKWRPQYYIALDYRALRDYGEVMEKQGVSWLFWGDTYKEFWMKKHPDNYLKHHLAYEYSEKRYPKFSEDFARKSYMGSTVTYNAIQLAVYMGFKEIYLLGVDFSYSGKHDEKYAHFFKEEKLISTGYEEQVRLAYLSAKKYADKHEINIYNATRGGKLEVFERVQFDDLFKTNI